MTILADPLLLILETSGRTGTVALARGQALLAVRKLDETRRHARDLAPAVGQLLADQNRSPRELNGVIVSQGPGSYTGLRVGIMSAKALAYATRCALIAVDTFSAIAWQTPPEMRSVDVIADAQQGKIYVQRFTRNSSQMAPASSSKLTIRPFSEWLATLEKSVWASGPGLTIYQEKMSPRLLVDSQLWHPLPESLLHLGYERYSAGQWADVYSLEPIYLRPSSAEEKREASSAV